MFLFSVKLSHILNGLKKRIIFSPTFTYVANQSLSSFKPLFLNVSYNIIFLFILLSYLPLQYLVTK